MKQPINGWASSFKNSKPGQWLLWLAIAIVVVLVGVQFTGNISKLFKKGLDFFGLEDSKEEAAIKDEISNPNSCFNPNFMKIYQKPTTQYKTYATMQGFAIRVGKARGDLPWNSDFPAAMAVFRELKNQCSVSYLSKVFQDIHQKAMLEYLEGSYMACFNDSQMDQIIKYCKSLPVA